MFLLISSFYFSEESQEKNGEGVQERPAMTIGILSEVWKRYDSSLVLSPQDCFETQKTNRPQKKNDGHEKVFEIQDQNGTICKPYVLHLDVDQNRNVPNQGPQERSEKTPVKSGEGVQERPAMTIGILSEVWKRYDSSLVLSPQDCFEPQKTNKIQDQNGTGYKSHVLHSGVAQNRNIPNQEPQERSEKTPVKSVKGEQDIEKLQIKIDDLQKKMECSLDKTEVISATMGDLLKKFDDLQKKFGTEYKSHMLHSGVNQNRNISNQDILQNKFDDLQKNIDKGKNDEYDLQEQIEQLKKEIEKKKAQFKSAWREIPLYADWRKEEFQTVNLTLDAATAHPALFLSEEGKRVTWQEPCQDLPRCPERFVSLPCVLGQLHVSSGRYFWEVEVQNAHSWDLGVCRDNVARSGRVTMSPQNGFWAIRLYSGEYWGLTSPETSLTLKEKPLHVGVFLDYEARDVSFYNMTDGSHIYTFSKQTFYGSLRPLFRLWSSDSGPLTIVQVE
nr:E3 ubiquitin-protein ligase TRIM38-like isoform X5 [Ovis aries]